MICIIFFFFNDTATTEIYTLSLHDALPICCSFVDLLEDKKVGQDGVDIEKAVGLRLTFRQPPSIEHFSDQFLFFLRSEEHTFELQSRQYLVCRLLLEKKKIILPSQTR